MFRKPKRSAKATLRKRNKKSTDGGDDIPDSRFTARESIHNSSDEESNAVIHHSRLSGKRRKLQNNKKKAATESGPTSLVHQYDSSKSKLLTAKELATREAEYHPEERCVTIPQNEELSYADNNTKIYNGAKKETNKFHAGPLKAPTFIRTTCRFDYQPDICKDYKETGFCGFGDTCIYLHDRGDTLSGWQLEQQWEERKKKEQEAKEKEMNKFIQSTSNAIGSKSYDAKEDNDFVVDTSDGIPYACHICRGPFTNPVVTTCMHYFNEKCIMEEYQKSAACPICKKDTHGVFNYPTKLIAKKRRVVGSKKGWDDYFNAMSKSNE